jgi:hypothetical protein
MLWAKAFSCTMKRALTASLPRHGWGFRVENAIPSVGMRRPMLIHPREYVLMSHAAFDYRGTDSRRRSIGWLEALTAFELSTDCSLLVCSITEDYMRRRVVSRDNRMLLQSICFRALVAEFPDKGFVCVQPHSSYRLIVLHDHLGRRPCIDLLRSVTIRKRGPGKLPRERKVRTECSAAQGVTQSLETAALAVGCNTRWKDVFGAPSQNTAGFTSYLMRDEP